MMDSSTLDPNDQTYSQLSGLNSTTATDDFGTIAAGNTDDAVFGSGQWFSPTTFDTTIAPSSLTLNYTSHDDSCINQATGCARSHLGPHRGMPPPMALTLAQSKPRYSNSISLPYNPGGGSMLPPAIPSFASACSFLPFDLDMKYPIATGRFGNRLFQSPTPNCFQVGLPYRVGALFNTPGFGAIQQQPVPEDCSSVNCSQFSCSTQCCSGPVCEDTACEEAGTPCNDLHCYEANDQGNFLSDGWTMPDWDMPTSIQQETLHSRPCNHTNLEHEAIDTLRTLGQVPAAPAPLQQSDFLDFEAPVVAAPKRPSSHMSTAPNTPPLTTGTSISSGSSVGAGVTSKKPKTEHQECTCLWLIPQQDGSDRQCGLKFDTHEELQKHLCADHVNLMSSRTKFQCLWDGCARDKEQDFASRNKLRRHINTHTGYKPFTCDVCKISFSAQQALDQHLRIHTGEKPYVCDWEGCGKAFKQKSALTMHKRTHTGEKPLVCETCGKHFGESSNLSKHRKTHFPDPKFKCEICNKSFIRFDQLRRHQMKHEKERKRKASSDRITKLHPTKHSRQASMALSHDSAVELSADHHHDAQLSFQNDETPQHQFTFSADGEDMRFYAGA